MIFERVRVRNFGVLKGPLSVEFGPGLNVIHGTNEAGKSTLVAAMWAALTLRHRVGGNDRRTLARVPRGGGVPEVEVSFTHRGARYEIAKRFAEQRGTARLRVTWPDGRLEDLLDAEAEARLQQILGLSAGADGKKDEDLGYLPLIWVRQERAARVPTEDLHEGGRAALAEQLGRLQGELLGGPDADRLFDAARAERDRFWTPTGQLRKSADGPFHAPERAAREASARLESLAARQREHEADLERIEAVAAELHALRGTLPALEDALRETETRRAALEALRREVEAARQQAELRRAHAIDARRRWDERCDSRTRLITAREAIGRLRAEAAEANALLQRVEGDELALRTAVQSAEHLESKLGRLWQRADAGLEVLRLSVDLDRQRAQQERVAGLLREQAERGQRLAASTVDEAVARRLDDLERRFGVAEAELRAASATVKIRGLADAGILVDDRPYPLRQGFSLEVTASQPLTVRVSELVEFIVVPGGRDLDGLRAQRDELRIAIDEALAAAGVSTTEAARQLAAERRDLSRRAEELTREIQREAPEGPDALKRGLSVAATTLSTRRSALATFGRDDDPPLPENVSAATELRAELDSRRSAARAAAQRERERLASHERSLVERRAAAARAADRLHDAEASLTALALELAHRTAADGDDETLKRSHLEAAAELARAEDSWKTQRAALDDSNPVEVEAAWRRASDAVGAGRARIDLLARSHAELSGRLGAADVAGLHERIAEASAALEGARAHLERLTEQAGTAMHLYDALLEARDRSRERFLGPLRDETERLLRLVFPAATLVFDEQFGLTEINRVEADTFDVLSVGTREQLGVIVRLAMAAVLAGDEPLPVILDDALVATDERRFTRMIPVLQDAASHLQVLMLTCHWSRYQAVGQVAQKVIDLDEIKRLAAS